MSFEQSMKAVRVSATGGAEMMRMEDVAIPTATGSDALVRLDAAGVNFIDVYKRTGLYKVPLPATLGEEGAGTVVAIGDQVTDVRVGDRVAWASVLGAYAEYAVVPSTKLVPLPASVSAAQGAATMLQGMTAHYLACTIYPLRAGDTCLIHAGAGGVGLLLIQIAKLRGATVIATAGSEEKAALARSVGADHTIVYTQQDFVAETKRTAGEGGVQVVFDSVGQSTFLAGFDVIARRGMMVLFGQSSGPVAPVDPQLLNQKGSLFLTRPTLAHYTATRAELLSRAGDLFEWISSGRLTVRIGAQFPLEQAGDAHRALEGRRTTGKVVLTIREP